MIDKQQYYFATLQDFIKCLKKISDPVERIRTHAIAFRVNENLKHLLYDPDNMEVDKLFIEAYQQINNFDMVSDLIIQVEHELEEK